MKKPLIFTLLLAISLSSYSSDSIKTYDRTFYINKNLNIYNSIMRELDLFYVDSLKYDKLTEKGISSMLADLDPYTVYMAEEKAEDIALMTKGEYGGIGAIIMKNGEDICISNPYEGMPAQKHGIKAGDRILEIDGKSTKGLSVSEVSALLRGTPSTTIKLKLQRPGSEETLNIDFLREKIQLPAISYSEVLKNKTGYIALNDFTDHIAADFQTIVSEMIENEKIESLIIDVRNNGGGLINEAVKILNFFTPKGTELVTTKGKTIESDQSYVGLSKPLFPNLKLAVLTNRSSASASEILAGAIQDLDRGVVIGERTFGKGLVQQIREVGYGSYLKLTTAKYYIPSGRCIQAINYSKRNEDGSVMSVPDSLSTVFHTKNGREVRDGGGIIPDTLLTEEKTVPVSFYIYVQNHFFNFATDYTLKHPSIAKVKDFKLSETDFKEFVDYLKEKKFTYTTQTEKYLDDLLKVAKFEGLDKKAEKEIDSLKIKLIPDIYQSVEENKTEINKILSEEIIRRYYYQKGASEYSLLSDKEVELAVEILNSKEYDKILAPVKKKEKAKKKSKS